MPRYGVRERQEKYYMNSVNDRNSITTNVEQKSENDLLNEELRIHGLRSSLPDNKFRY